MADGQYHNILVPVDGSKVTAQVLEKGIACSDKHPLSSVFHRTDA